jgi:hypothetical protein
MPRTLTVGLACRDGGETVFATFHVFGCQMGK